MRFLLAAVLAAGALLLNPAAGCEGGYQFDATEMRAAVAGTWRVTLPDGRQIRVEFSQAAKLAVRDQSSWVAPAHACGERTLVTSASACVDMTEMPLQVAVLDGRSDIDHVFTAKFRVFAKTFSAGQLSLRYDGNYVDAQISPSGDLIDQYGDIKIERVRA